MTVAISPLELTRFKELIRTRCGLRLDGLGEDTLIAAIEKRRAATGANGAAAYFALAAEREDEFQEFVALMTINETYFFREPEQIALLTDTLLPRLLTAHVPLPLRILSAGCSTGEEPYSIAIAALEHYGEGASHLVEIVGGDIDRYALIKARAAQYSKFSFRGVSDSLRDRYFDPIAGSRYALSPRVAAMVRFTPLNLLTGPFSADLSAFDVIFFRNVSIYFDEQERRTIQRHLFEAMAPHGVLIIGATETIANDFGIFRQEEIDGRFYFAKGAASPSHQRFAPGGERPSRAGPKRTAVQPPSRIPAPPAVKPEPTIEMETAADVAARMREWIRDKRYAEAQEILAIWNAKPTRDARLLALDGYIHMMNRDFAGAERRACEAMAVDEWSNDAIVLRGLAAKWQGRSDDAVGMFQRGIYNQFDCWPAYYYLGELYRAHPDLGDWRRLYRTTQQLLTARVDADGGLTLPLDLPVAEVRALCAHYLGDRQVVGG